MNNKRMDKLAASFRDPSGFIFFDKGALKRQVNNSYADNYELLMKGGLYGELVKKQLLIPHREDGNKPGNGCYKIIEPRKIPFVSYPYEWSFGQLKDAALATLAIQKIAMKHGMSLKDASAFNIQFYQGKPLLIDTLSFEQLDETRPWVAYRQFCQHFLAPLALAAFRDVRTIQLFRSNVDGIPLDLASSLLPTRTKLLPTLAIHIHLHASSQKKYGSKKIERKDHKMGKYALQGLISSLIKAIGKLHWKRTDSEWGDYYSFTNYSNESFQEKKSIIERYIGKLPEKPRSVWDLGGNTGLFSRIASNQKINTVSFDIDYSAVEQNYQQVKKAKESNILPLFIDLNNPSPALGWAHNERESLQQRGPADLGLALALIHHISISNNVPFGSVAQYFSKLCKDLIIEFVPKGDSNAQRLLAMREDIFPKYDRENFELEFGRYYKISERTSIKNSKRILYLLTRIDEI